MVFTDVYRSLSSRFRKVTSLKEQENLSRYEVAALILKA